MAANSDSGSATVVNIMDYLGAKSPAEVTPWLNMLIYGEPGVGKTHLCGTAAQSDIMAPVLFLDIEGGTATLRKMKEVEYVVPIRSLDDLMKVHTSVTTALHDGAENAPVTVIIDSLTELQKLDCNAILMYAIENNEKGIDPKQPVMGIRQWGITLDHMRQIVRKFRDLPCNVIFTALEKTETDNNGLRQSLPSISGKGAMEVCGFLDIVGRYSVVVEKDNIERRLQFQKTNTTMAKDRLGVLDPVTINPTLPALWERMHSTTA